MRKPVIAGNWKMHLTLADARTLVQLLKGLCDTDAVEVIVCPPFTALSSVAELLKGSRISLGAQDMFWEPQGAFTGEISPVMLRDVGCRHVIIGHSERRTHFGETDQSVQRKLVAALAHQLIPILCIGETLSEREANQTLAVLTRQLEGALKDVPALDRTLSRAQAGSEMIVAYEPVWALGTGRNATPQQAQEAHAAIRQWLAARYGSRVSESIRIQYGGSVTAANAAGLLQQPDVDGALVGGASLKADTFGAIIKAALEAKAVTR